MADEKKRREDDDLPRTEEERVDDALEDTFPASDPPAYAGPPKPKPPKT